MSSKKYALRYIESLRSETRNEEAKCSRVAASKPRTLSSSASHDLGATLIVSILIQEIAFGASNVSIDVPFQWFENEGGPVLRLMILRRADLANIWMWPRAKGMATSSSEPAQKHLARPYSQAGVVRSPANAVVENEVHIAQNAGKPCIASINTRAPASGSREAAYSFPKHPGVAQARMFEGIDAVAHSRNARARVLMCGAELVPRPPGQCTRRVNARDHQNIPKSSTP